MTPMLLDTHVLIWWFENDNRLPLRIRRALHHVAPDRPALIADISLWETAMLADRGRIRLSMPLVEWLDRASAPPLVQRVAISPAIAAESARISEVLRDPADRIIVATARVIGAKLATCDERIKESGQVRVL